MRPLSFARFAVVGFAAAVLFAEPERASATLVTELSLDELAAEADAVVHARVSRVASRTSPLGGRLVPFRIVTLSVVEWLKGEGAGEVVVREVGGESRGVRVEREGTPEYHRGEEVVVFLRRDGDSYATLGMAQGCFHVVGDRGRGRFVAREMHGLTFVRADGARVSARAGGPRERLDELLARTRTSVGRGRP